MSKKVCRHLTLSCRRGLNHLQLQDPDIDSVIVRFNQSLGPRAIQKPGARPEQCVPAMDEDLEMIALDFDSQQSEDADMKSLSAESESGPDWELGDLVIDDSSTLERINGNVDVRGQEDVQLTQCISKEMRDHAQIITDSVNDMLNYADLNDLHVTLEETVEDIEKSISNSGSEAGGQPFESNFFFLLASCGTFLLPSKVKKEGLRWSSKNEWWLCSILENGFPWNIANPSQMYKQLLYDAQVQSHWADRKTLLLTSSQAAKVLSDDWKVYEKTRMMLLQTKGQNFMQSFLNAKESASRSISLKNKRGCSYFSNSCALDSILYIFPHLFWYIAKRNLLDGSNTTSLSVKAPGAVVLCVILENLFELRALPYRDRRQKELSNYLRVLVQDLACFYRPKGRKPLPRMWDPFKKNGFMNIHEVILYILPRLLAAKAHSCLPTSLYFGRLTINEEKLKILLSASTFSSVLHSLILNDHADRTGACYVFHIDPRFARERGELLASLLQGSSTHIDASYEVKIVGYLGYKRCSEGTHFISGVVYGTKNGECLSIYDGMTNSGLPKPTNIKVAFVGERSVFSLESLLCLAVFSTENK